jgi:1-pyrroline-5-carboxylate dehydrogenase
VLAVIKSQNFDDALQIANNTEYGLTGAVYTKSREKLERAKREIPRRQSVFQPQMHGRDGGRASLWRIQHERHGFEGGRPGLPVAVHPGKVIAEKIGIASSAAEEEEEKRMGI